MRPDRKAKPLYRKVNTRARGVWHNKGGDYRHERNSKREKQAVEDEVTLGTMHIKAQRSSDKGKKQRGLDYTPLYRFLLSKVGAEWEAVYKEAAARLDKPDPIFHIVTLDPDDRYPVARAENAYYSRLYVDENGILAVIDPSIGVEDIRPSCACCTHTFNGQPVTREWVWGEYNTFDR